MLQAEGKWDECTMKGVAVAERSTLGDDRTSSSESSFHAVL